MNSFGYYKITDYYDNKSRSSYSIAIINTRLSNLIISRQSPPSMYERHQGNTNHKGSSFLLQLTVDIRLSRGGKIGPPGVIFGTIAKTVIMLLCVNSIVRMTS